MFAYANFFLLLCTDIKKGFFCRKWQLILYKTDY